jgi:hypothetical protein
MPGEAAETALAGVKTWELGLLVDGEPVCKRQPNSSDHGRPASGDATVLDART